MSLDYGYYAGTRLGFDHALLAATTTAAVKPRLAFTETFPCPAARLEFQSLQRELARKAANAGVPAPTIDTAWEKDDAAAEFLVRFTWRWGTKAQQESFRFPCASALEAAPGWPMPSFSASMLAHSVAEERARETLLPSSALAPHAALWGSPCFSKAQLAEISKRIREVFSTPETKPGSAPNA
jgi:hypothetical protein